MRSAGRRVGEPGGPAAVLFGPPVSFDGLGVVGRGAGIWVGLGPGRRSARLGWNCPFGRGARRGRRRAVGRTISPLRQTGRPKTKVRVRMVETSGFEPPTPCVQSRTSRIPADADKQEAPLYGVYRHPRTAPDGDGCSIDVRFCPGTSNHGILRSKEFRTPSNCAVVVNPCELQRVSSLAHYGNVFRPRLRCKSRLDNDLLSTPESTRREANLSRC